MEDWAEIRRLHRAEELPIKLIARTLGVSRDTVRAALPAEGPPRYVRKPAGSAVDVFEPRIREQLQAVPTMPATVIAERVGWTRGMTVFKRRVAELRPACLPVDPASRTTHEPGELAQFDFWFSDIELPVGYGQAGTAKRPPVTTTVTGYSPVRRPADPLAGGRGPVRRVVAAALEAAAGGTQDAGVGRRSSGCTTTWRSPSCRARCSPPRRTSISSRPGSSPRPTPTGCGCWAAPPGDRVAADRAAMLLFPPVLPEVGWCKTVRLPRDHYVRIDSNDYSVHPAVIGRRVEVHADLDRVWVTREGAVVAHHARVWARHQTITDFEHGVAAKHLRRGRADLLRPVADAAPRRRGRDPLPRGL